MFYKNNMKYEQIYIKDHVLEESKIIKLKNQ
jgi:hypothetical protein